MNKKILFDLGHSAHINFFKKLINDLKLMDYQVDIVLLDRGRNTQIFIKEYPDYTYTVIGKQYRDKFRLYTFKGILRFIVLFYKYIFKKYDFFIGVAIFQLGFISKFKMKTKSIIVDDDPESKVEFFLDSLSATYLVTPKVCETFKSNNITFNGLKEWAYLSPSIFKINDFVLKKFNLQPYEFVFIREIDNTTINYSDQKNSFIEEIYNSNLIQIPVLLSLENKSRKHLFPNWIQLEEPIEHIHSLIFYSRFLLSNGDSMAREASMLGTESIYSGIRKMKSNKELLDLSLMYHIINYNDFKLLYYRLLNYSKDEIISKQELKRKLLLEKWDDINQILLNLILGKIK